MVKVASHQKIKEPKTGHQGTWLDKYGRTRSKTQILRYDAASQLGSWRAFQIE